MSEVTDVDAGEKKGKGKKGNADNSPTIEGQIGRMLVRAIWAQEWVAAHPDAKPEERKAAWKAGRAEVIEKNLKLYRRALNSLTRSGVTMTLSETATEDDDADA